MIEGLKKEFQELHRYRYLIYSFISVKLKQRYRRSFFGYLWTVFTPLVNYIIMGIVIGFIARDTVPNYFFYFISGSVFFNLFNAVISSSFNCLIGNENFIKKIYIPKMVFFLNLIGLEFVNFVLALLTLLALSIAVGYMDFSFMIFAIFIPIFFSAIFLIGVSTLVGVASVFFRDFQYIIPVLMQAAFFLTPILYAPEMIPEKYRMYCYINPFYYFIECFRVPLMHHKLADPSYYLIMAVVSVVALVAGYTLLKKQENRIVFKL